MSLLCIGLAVAAILGATPSAAPSSVVVFPALGRPTLVTVSGRVVHGDPERTGSPVRRNARRLLAKSGEHVQVTVSFAGRSRSVISGDDGLFVASFAAPGHAPFEEGVHAVRAEVDGAAGGGKVEVVSDAAPFLVVSDLDDTLAVSNVQSKRGLLESSLLADERTQAAVPGMSSFYRCLREGKAPPPGFVVVSGSPLEYGPRIEAFLARNGFPFSALVLRHLGPGTAKGYKEPALRALLSTFPQRVVLVGDSGERDPEIYALMRREFPGRVEAIFIRNVGRSADPARLEGMVLFESARDAARTAAARGLVTPSCVDQAFPVPPAPAPPPAPPGRIDRDPDPDRSFGRSP